MAVDDFGNAVEVAVLERRSAAYHRAAAARARNLQAESTTPRLKEYLGEVIAAVTDWRTRSRNHLSGTDA